MNQERLVALIENDFHDSLHNVIWDVDLLGSLHFDENMLDAGRFHEGLIAFWIILIHECTS